MSETPARPSHAAPAAPPAFSIAKPDPAACASKLRIEGTLPAGEWTAVIDAVSSRVRKHNADEGRKHAAAKQRLVIALVVLVAGAIGLAVAGGVALGEGAIVAAFVGLVVGIFVVFAMFKVPGRDHIGEERVKFLAGLLADLGKIAPGARVSLAAQLDSRQAFDTQPLEGSGPGRAVRDREDDWLRGRLAGLRGLQLGWSVTDRNSITLVRKRNPRGKVKNKGKFSVARRFSVRIDADGALFSATPAAPAKAGPATVIEVRTQARGYSVRARHDFKAGAALPNPLQVEESLVLIRENAARHGQDRADYFGEFASTLIHLMKQCEQRLEPRASKKEAA